MATSCGCDSRRPHQSSSPESSAHMTAPISLHLIGSHVRLRVMGEADAPALVRAASEGELRNLEVTVVPSEATVAAYMKPALDGLRAGTLIPYEIDRVAKGEA